ncbi:DMT family transporter [Jiella sp. M17.18]|uniref:DMT family transporter n=1 Tax=Jiella sp. M17.18 TaxID=3234247 RepID=UPI0034E02E4C
MSRLRANFLLLLAGAVWGMGFVAQSTAMGALGPWTFVAVRFALAALTLLPFAWFESRRAARPLPRATLGGFLLIGAALFVAAITQQIGIVTTTVTNSGFLTGLYVVLTPVLALLFLKHRPHWVVWPAALAAFCGIVLLGGGSLSALGPGDIWTIVCALFWALQILFVGVFSGSSNRPYMLSFVQFAVTALLAAIGAVLLETPTAAAVAAVWPEIVYGGVFSSGLAFTLQVLGQGHTSAAQASIFLSSESLFAALFGGLVLGERIAPIGFLGCALIFAAMLAVELVPLILPKERNRASSPRRATG